MTVEVDPIPHAVLGASGMYRWSRCGASVSRFDHQKLKRQTSFYALEGTAGHEVHERALRDTRLSRSHFLGKQIHVKQDGAPTAVFTVDNEMLSAVWQSVEFCRQLILDSTAHGVEHQVKLGPFVQPAGVTSPMFGTMDFWALVGRTLHVLDYKHGRGVGVEVEQNMQLLYYALGVLLDVTRRLGRHVSDVVLHVAQPRYPHRAGPIRSWALPAVDVLMWGHDELIPAALRAEDPDAPFVSGRHCHWCPALLVCPQQAKDRQTLARQEFA